MIHLTRQERQVFIFLIAAVFIGLALSLSLKERWDRLSFFHVLDDPSFYPRIDINRASLAELVSVPGLGERTATLIVERRPFRSLEGLRALPGMGEGKFRKLEKCLKVK